jgi:kynurenine formamidase
METGAFVREVRDRAHVEELAGRHSNWGRWGEDDELGALNLIEEAEVVRAAGLVRRGRTFSLALPLDRTGPQGAHDARINAQHVMLLTPDTPVLDDDGLQRYADDAMYLPLQCSTQWDALSHVFHDGRAYNGRDFRSVTAQGALANSIAAARSRVVARGVLLDLARFAGVEWLEAGTCIQERDLEACAESQGVEVRAGDIVCVRTGQISERRRHGWGDYADGPAPGLGLGAADFLCPRDVAAVASDTWGLEANPPEAAELKSPLHVVLLVHAGMLIGEMWDLDELAADCAADGVYEFLLAAQPLHIPRAVGSPINPIAVK